MPSWWSATPSTARRLRAWCAERLSDYKVPETIELTSDPLPRNANGKVMKRQLREAWAARLQTKLQAPTRFA